MIDLELVKACGLCPAPILTIAFGASMSHIIHFNEMNVEVSQDYHTGHWQAWEAGTYVG